MRGKLFKAMIVVVATVGASVFFGVAIWLNGGLCVTSLPKAVLLERFNKTFVRDAALKDEFSFEDKAKFCSIDKEAHVDLGFFVEAKCQVWTNEAHTAFEGRRYAATRCGSISYLYGFSDQTFK